MAPTKKATTPEVKSVESKPVVEAKAVEVVKPVEVKAVEAAKVEAPKKAKTAPKAAAAQNTILAKFINNLESRIYSQLAAQLTSNLFGETPQNSGTFTLDGNTISYVKDPTGQTLTMTITDSNKNITTITIPLTGFTF